MVSEHGPNLFYYSVENRKYCCNVRKVEPLKRRLATLDGWICGLRRDQSITRNDLQVIEWNEGNELIKISPLVEWSEEEVWDYIRENDVPYNMLHDKNFPSIGCAPCTRAVKPGEDVRAGRWWWENPEYRECGLHEKNS
jgi:phosphoadenosine phosphosulfate reductase